MKQEGNQRVYVEKWFVYEAVKFIRIYYSTRNTGTPTFNVMVIVYKNTETFAENVMKTINMFFTIF